MKRSAEHEPIRGIHRRDWRAETGAERRRLVLRGESLPRGGKSEPRGAAPGEAPRCPDRKGGREFKPSTGRLRGFPAWRESEGRPTHAASTACESISPLFSFLNVTCVSTAHSHAGIRIPGSGTCGLRCFQSVSWCQGWCHLLCQLRGKRRTCGYPGGVVRNPFHGLENAHAMVSSG